MADNHRLGTRDTTLKIDRRRRIHRAYSSALRAMTAKRGGPEAMDPEQLLLAHQIAEGAALRTAVFAQLISEGGSVSTVRAAELWAEWDSKAVQVRAAIGALRTLDSASNAERGFPETFAAAMAQIVDNPPDRLPAIRPGDAKG